MTARPVSRFAVALALFAGLTASAGVVALAWWFPVQAAALHDAASRAAGLDSSRLGHQLIELLAQFAVMAVAGTLAYGVVIALVAGRLPRLWRLTAAGGLMAGLPALAIALALLTPMPVSMAPFAAAIGYFAGGFALRDWIVRPGAR